MKHKNKKIQINILQVCEILFIILIVINILSLNSYLLSIIFLSVFILLYVFNFISTYKQSHQLKVINARINAEIDKGLAHFIELKFEIKGKGEISKLAGNLNTILQEVKKIFWDIKENLFATKISKSTLDNIQILMISYIQKVVNIGSVRTQLESICARINEATNSTKLILNSIIDLANQTNKEAVTIKKTSNALEKLLVTIAEITDMTQDKQKMAEKLKETARVGKAKVGKTTEIIRTINESTGEMLKIIEIINNIAESTNILSINAGIEAAHAGKEGKGFRVIADEIIKLVASTKKKAGEISKLLKDQVDKMTMALQESKVSGNVLDNVNTEVQDAANTWIAISNKTMDMSRGTHLIQETTESMFEITQAVSNSSEAIKQSVEKINNEASELDEATNKTLDILEKVTVTNEEAKQSTVTILQQLNEMTKFVNKLNKAIDFFNLGKRIFFLFINNDTFRYVNAIIRKEYEAYQTNDYKNLLRIFKEYSNSVLLINADLAPPEFNFPDYINTIKKLPDSKNISIGVLSTSQREEEKLTCKHCEFILLINKSEVKNMQKIIEFIEIKRAKGLRKQVRVICSQKDNIKVYFSFNAKTYEGTILDICSGALVAGIPKESGVKTINKKFEVFISIEDDKYKITGKSGILKADNNYLIIFEENEKDNLAAKDAIYNFIFKKLQDQLETEMTKTK